MYVGQLPGGQAFFQMGKDVVVFFPLDFCLFPIGKKNLPLVRDRLEKLAGSLPDGLASKVADIIANRDRFFITDWSQASYVLHPHYRGRLLPAEQLRSSVLFIVNVA